MSFQWPEMLWLMAAVPLLIAFYFWVLQRRKRFAIRYASLGLLKEAMAGLSWRRHVPPALLLLALAVMIAAIARPTATVTLPSQHETVILAMDVTGCMPGTDVHANCRVAAH